MPFPTLVIEDHHVRIGDDQPVDLPGEDERTAATFDHAGHWHFGATARREERRVLRLVENPQHFARDLLLRCLV